jgi:hypothetical protein
MYTKIQYNDEFNNNLLQKTPYLLYYSVLLFNQPFDQKTIIALLLVLTQLVKSLASRSSGRNNFSVAFITTLCPWTLNYLFGCDDL